MKQVLSDTELLYLQIAISYEFEQEVKDGDRLLNTVLSILNIEKPKTRKRKTKIKF